ncbi:MAG TPA: porphobilinogen synthase, partial [Pirellulaceae bacterium]|nr:porphobilinogen synthase [Pirellulaceae bacterium]
MDACSGFPTTRLRRLRYHPAVRSLVRETRLSPASLILPLFARPGKAVRQPIASMPGHAQLSVDQIAEEALLAKKLGL